MGVLRLLFALSVVMFHIYPLWQFPGFSSTAVHSFFIISGFYMSLILNEKYINKNGSYRLFITNRFLRIFPLYWIILLLTFTFSFYKFLMVPGNESYIHLVINFLSQSTQSAFDLIMIILRNISLIVTTDYFFHNFKDPGYLLIPPAWSLQIELLFYLMAPVLVKLRVPVLVILTVLFSIATFGFQEKISPNDTSLFLIFVTKFVFFLFGMLSYQLYVVLKKKNSTHSISRTIAFTLPLFILIFGSTSGIIVLNFSLQKIILFFYFLILAVSIAYVFHYSKNIPFDRALGELSYPVYLSHPLIFKLVNTSPLASHNHYIVTFSCIFLTILLSFILIRTVENPIDKLRHSFLR